MCPATSALEDAPTREPMKASRSARKERTDFLLLLRRFLVNSKDRPWADVHRELSLRFCTTSSEKRMLQSRLPQVVALDVVARGDELIRADTEQPLARTAPTSNLYVCPNTGLLRRFNPEDARNRLQLSEWELVRRLGKRWYVLELAPLPGDQERQHQVDVVLAKIVNQASPALVARLAHLYGRAGVFARSRRQIGKAELEKLRADHHAASAPIRPGRITPRSR